jgi:hypothetical protein
MCARLTVSLRYVSHRSLAEEDISAAAMGETHGIKHNICRIVDHP